MTFQEQLTHPIFEYVKKASMQLGLETYVIGGYVRDILLKRDNKKDIDFVTVGDGILLAETVAQLLPHQPKVQFFKNYGTAMFRFEDWDIEFVGARKESYQSESRNPSVSVGTLQDDQERRDFTINAMAFSVNENNYGQLIDPFNGIDDLKLKIIKTPLEPGVTFSDDPLRMLRAIRFASQLNFIIDEVVLT